MMKLAVAAAVALCAAASANATVLNLDSLPQGYITQTITLGDYTISPSGGLSANPYITSVNGHNVLIGTDTTYGDDAIIRRVDGGAFTLASVVIGVQSYSTGQNIAASNGYNLDLNNVATTTQQTLNFTTQFQNVTFVDLNGLKNAYYTNIVLTSSAVPEPASWAMMIVGFGFVGFTMRHRRRNGTGASLAA